jgi:DNA (cytosine-5)-methyltransferase 1
MRYGSICSGIEAASVAWHPLGWEPAWFSEIDTFPSAVLNHRFPGVPNHGDFTQILRDESHPARSVPIDVLVGGTPCQAFSVAGLRRGFDDDRGNLTLAFCRLVGLLRPRWVVWENVPGVLSIDGGRAFGSILGAFRELGYGFAYRILDAQHFGVPQRRRRVFLVGHSGGDWRAPATVLFEPEGVFRNPPPSAKARKGASRSPRSGAPSDSQRVMRRVAIGAYTEGDVACTQSAREYKDGSDLVMRGGFVPQRVIWSASDQANAERFVDMAGTLNCNDGQRGGFIVPLSASVPGAIAFHPTQDPISSEGRTPPLSADADKGDQDTVVLAPTADTRTPAVAIPILEAGKRVDHSVRRLTPVECEKLQGFPDGWTQVPFRNKPAADGPRYKALGNSMAVPVMRWIGSRIAKVDAILRTV